MRPNLLKEQPRFTEKQKNELNLVARYLAEKWMTKSEVSKLINKGERVARDYISEIAKKVPIISTSSNAGYKRALNERDFDLAIQTRNELRSRIDNLKQRLIPIEEFIKKISLSEGRDG